MQKYPGCLARFAVTDVGRLYNFQGIEEWIIFSLHISVKVLISSWISISLYNKKLSLGIFVISYFVKLIKLKHIKVLPNPIFSPKIPPSGSDITSACK